MAKALETQSERLFECYVRKRRELTYNREEDYEPSICGKKPDFRVWWQGSEYLFDVKERRARGAPIGARHFDPTKGIRRMIEKGREKFSGFDDHCCSLVCYDAGDCNVRLTPMFVFEAMLGDGGVESDFDPASGTVDATSAHSVFVGRGKMVKHYQPLEPHGSTRNLSAILILERHEVANVRYERELVQEQHRHEAALGRSLTAEEKACIAIETCRSEPLRLGTRKE